MSNKPWVDRIVGHDRLPPVQVVPNDKNWRRHPKAQLEALAGAIDRIGFIRSVTVNKRTGHLIDGHGRLKLALDRKEPLLSVEYVDLSPEEEAIALATLDPLAAMADTDQEALDSLLSTIHTDDARLRSLIDSLASETEEAVSEVPEQEPKLVELKPPPEVIWVLIGIPLNEYGEARKHVAVLEKNSLITVQTNRDAEG